MMLQDDRTPEQRATHCVLWGGTDSFMSGWGWARDGNSYAFWACKPEDSFDVERMVRARAEMRRVREVGAGYRPPAGSGHCHIYVWA